ncbi:MAG: hypothetical protein HOG49_38715 [Candidatus Scalindua sp.]|nr:hypothetical protein [Candidatus Scalindua sp.]
MKRVLIFSYLESTIDLINIVGKYAEVIGVILPISRIKDIDQSVYDFLKEKKINSYTQYYSTDSKSEELARNLKNINVDLIVTYSYPMILSKNLIETASMGGINIHNGLLPEHRGCNVLNWVLVNGEKSTGVTIHWLDEWIDTGDIIGRRTIDINFEDTALTLRNKLIKEGLALINKLIPQIMYDSAPRMRQNSDNACYYRKRTPEDGLINWYKMSDKEIYNLIRALVPPWPGAFYTDESGKKAVFDKLINLDEIAEIRNGLKLSMTDYKEQN